MRFFFLSVLLLGFSGTSAASWDDIVDQAFDSMVDDMDEHYAYTETRRSKDGDTIARHDPRRADGERWTLTSVDNREPSEDEIEEFLQQKETRRENESDDDDDDDDDGIKSIIAAGSLGLIEETEMHWLFSFKPAADTDEEKAFMDAVDGTLLIVKDGHYVSEIRLQNSETIKPGKGVKIEEFRTTMLFAPISKNGPTAPQTVRTAVKGRAMLVIGIDETEVVEFSDFEIANEK